MHPKNWLVCQLEGKGQIQAFKFFSCNRRRISLIFIFVYLSNERYLNYFFFQKVLFSINFHNFFLKNANYVILEVTDDAILMETNKKHELNKLES